MWRKSSYSKALSNCVEWRTSSHSHAANNCVEVRGVQVRDSKDPAGPVLAFTPAAWNAFVSAIKAGHLTHP